MLNSLDISSLPLNLDLTSVCFF